MTLTPSDYLGLYSSCLVTKDSNQFRQIMNVCRIALINQSTYIQVSSLNGVPWEVVAAIHFRESNQSFKCHLHNGDLLTSRTVHVPKDRPISGSPPFTWVESALDAFTDRWFPHEWDIANALQFIERFNGVGYQKHGINTPYLWDFTDKYSSGLFISDGSFDPNTKEERPGAVPILKQLGFMGASSALGVH